MGLFGENVRNFNEDFLKKKGYGIVKRGEFIKFMKSNGLNYKKDKITEELFNQYLQSNGQQQYLKYEEKEEKKLENERLKEDEKIISDFNKKFLKEHGIGFLEKEDFKSFLTSIGVNYNNTKLTEDVFNQYIQFKEDSKSAYSFNNDFLKDKNVGFVEKGAVINFMGSIGLNYNEDRLTDELFDKYLQSKDYDEAEAEKLGVVGYDFKCNLHEKRMNTGGEQKTEYYDGYCFIKEDRLVIKKRSGFRHKDVGDKVVPYANINAIDYDKATGFHITSSIVISISGFDTIILKNTTQKISNSYMIHG